MFNQWEIQRYLDESKLLRLIDDNGLFFNRINNFPLDPSEGDGEFWGVKEQQNAKALYPLFVQRFGNISYELFEANCIKQLKEFHDSQKNFIFIQSWFKDRETSKVMWDEYSKYNENPNCALVVTDIITLGNVIDSHFPIGNGMKKVTYVLDKNKERDSIFTKDEKFIHEKEYRLSLELQFLGLFNHKLLEILNFDESIVESFKNQKHTIQDISQYYRNDGIALESSFSPRSQTGFIVNLPINDFIKKIYIPTKASNVFYESIVSKLKEKNFLNIECIRIDVENGKIVD
ncbi:hypothetical protein KW868_16115 [Acinetobacter guillouiae]|uniref:DUF2971 domain-containing protein n=1 Tax=Acinetobacter guillouiae TaxID=106649 RepID=A0A8X8GF28_ACIGI|nr:hypothetical protein [Acinetobacter guillouiae]MCF0265973.1 hypothetical protein [Acinetobacter guillouiae]